jgi:hypothetical protein
MTELIDGDTATTPEETSLFTPASARHAMPPTTRTPTGVPPLRR